MSKAPSVAHQGEEVAGAAAAVWTPIDELRPWGNNPRKNDGKPVEKVMASIEAFGFGEPILATLDGEIIAGHTRWKASKQLGRTLVPVRFMPLEEARAHALAIADNRTAEEAEWDDDFLADALREVQSQDDEALLKATAFDDGELNMLLSPKGENDAEAEWIGMPECVSEDQTAFRQILVSFKNQEDVDAFAKLIGQTFTPKTRFTWFPEAELLIVHDKAWVQEGDTTSHGRAARRRDVKEGK